MLRKITLWLLLAFATAGADYHYASHSGSNQYPYTSWETAADSIQKAINSASPGDTIYVGSGVWEDVPYTLHDSLSIIGRGVDSTTIRKGYYPAMIHFFTVYSHNLIKGFKLDGVDVEYPRDGIQGNLHAQDIAIADNGFFNLGNCILLGDNSGVIENNVFSAFDQGIDAGFEPCSFEVRGNTFSGGRMPIYAYHGRWIVTGNVFHHNPNAANGWLILFSVFGVGDTAYIANNLFFRNLEAETFENTELLGVGAKAYLENNTFVGDPVIGGSSPSAASPTARAGETSPTTSSRAFAGP